MSARVPPTGGRAATGLRLAFLAGIALLPVTPAHAQLCTQFFPCQPGYYCSKPSPTSPNGQCIPLGVTRPSRPVEQFPECHLRSYKGLCLKTDDCIWLERTEFCITKPPKREGEEDDPADKPPADGAKDPGAKGTPGKGTPGKPGTVPGKAPPPPRSLP